MHILHQMGYSLKPNKKNIEGESHEDRDLQFQHILLTTNVRFLRITGIQSFLIDCKKEGEIRQTLRTMELNGQKKENRMRYKSMHMTLPHYR